MRRPGTLPNSSSSSSSSGHRAGGVVMSDATSGGPDTVTSRFHYSNHSLRRGNTSTSTAQPPLPPRDNDTCVDRIQNGVPGHHSHHHYHQQQHTPPPLPSRHSPSCAQSSNNYPTLPMNGHPSSHHYHHYTRERDKDRTSGRQRERDQHRAESHRDNHMEMELRDSLDMMGAGIGTYRA
ncbi:uncharacterized protein [Prorops nasuta]|uniref:uncharacterized protein n=1 Tax=Prorops nasuta TaxID=863751 RepID=UPI0034CF4D2A